MFSHIHNKLGTAGLVVAIVALVAAVGGTAIAALPGLNSKQKKQVTKIAKKVAGQNGAAGPQGPVGPPGPAGTNGTNGTNGVSPVGTAFSGAKGACTEGGVEFKGANTTFACNGQAGPTETKLPSGQSLKGLWDFQTTGFESAFLTISFPLRVEPTPQWHWIGEGEASTTECPGTSADPKALPGHFCIYADNIAGAAAAFPNEFAGFDPSAGWRGEFSVAESEPALGFGSWAVTAQ